MSTTNYQSESIALCSNTTFESVERLREIAKLLHIHDIKMKSKKNLCQEIGEKLETAIENVRTIEDDSDTDITDYLDVVTTELLVEPVKVSSYIHSKYYVNLSTYRRLAHAYKVPGSTFPSPMDRTPLIKDMSKVQIDREKQNSVLQFISDHGLDMPTAELDQNFEEDVPADNVIKEFLQNLAPLFSMDYTWRLNFHQINAELDQCIDQFLNTANNIHSIRSTCRVFESYLQVSWSDRDQYWYIRLGEYLDTLSQTEFNGNGPYFSNSDSIRIWWNFYLQVVDDRHTQGMRPRLQRV